MALRAPKQWSLTKNETITSFESWKQNLIYSLSLDLSFALFLITGSTWTKKTRTTPLRGLVDDPEGTPNRRNAAQKVAQLDLLLGQIANYCPIISRNTITKNSTSIDNIWQSIRAHFGFQSKQTNAQRIYTNASWPLLKIAFFLPPPGYHIMEKFLQRRKN